MISLECEPWLWNAIVQHLKTKTGLSCDCLGSLNIRRSIAHRMKLTQTRTVANYWFQLQQNGSEWQAFLDEVVVPETSFFRDRVPFQLLAQWSQAKSLTDRKLRILSLPCSTGEEPYSIALTLLGAGLSLDQFEIDAIDVSDRALIVARQGRYNVNPLGPLWAKSYRYWRWQNQSLQILPDVLRSIHFKLGNAMDLALQSSMPESNSSDLLYDIIFCRNLLIYFDPETRQNVLKGFDRLLRSDGLLFVGHAETGALGRDYWTMFPHSYAFAYQKMRPKIPQSKVQRSAPKNVARSVSSVLPNCSANDSKMVGNLLARSRELADMGQLDSALEICEEYLKTQPLCGEGYSLMGQICQAIGSLVESDRYLAKAVYLMPNNEDALMQLALLRESQGDAAGAKVLKLRMVAISRRNPLAPNSGGI